MIARSKSAQTARRYEIVTRETFSHPPSDMKDATTRTNWIDERHLAQTGLESFYFFASKTYFLRQQLRTRERDNDTRCYHCYPFTLFFKIFICISKKCRETAGQKCFVSYLFNLGLYKIVTTHFVPQAIKNAIATDVTMAHEMVIFRSKNISRRSFGIILTLFLPTTNVTSSSSSLSIPKPNCSVLFIVVCHDVSSTVVASSSSIVASSPSIST